MIDLCPSELSFFSSFILYESYYLTLLYASKTSKYISMWFNVKPKNWTYLIHWVSIRKRTDIRQLCTRWKFIANFTHYEMSKIFHSLWSTAHTNELQWNRIRNELNQSSRKAQTIIAFYTSFFLQLICTKDEESCR